ncbi:MAG TPA: DUF2911 domain-containing protein [Chitinophagaceae bacterium]|jgi:hypothetical protein|nr:DUF2911 domain-containing protein [Chitinophagaceae bacterium]
MKKNLLLTIACCIVLSVTQAQLKTPQPSPTQTISQNFGISNIELSYSRPGMKGRKIFGDLVPFGSIWRTGANQATTISFGDDVTIGGTKIPAGKYTILSIPEKDNWTLIITRPDTANQAYNKERDVARVNVKPTKTPMPVESFTMLFANVKPTSCELHIQWENTSVSLPITTDVDTKVMAQISQAMTSDKPPYFEAASYYFDNGKDVNQAKEWAMKAVEKDPAFYVVHLLAKIQAKSGDKAAAIETAKKSIELSKAAKNQDYVRLNEKLIASLK